MHDRRTPRRLSRLIEDDRSVPPRGPIPCYPKPTFFFDPSLPRHYRVDLQVKVLNADGQIPTVYPPELFGSEFTGNFVSFGASTASATIGVNRQIRRMPGMTATVSLLSTSAWYRQLFSVE